MNNTTGQNPSLLEGIKILDMTINFPGPIAGAILTQLGAEVIKIEPPTGDPVSHSPALYDAINGKKQRMSYNLKNEAEAKEVMDLIATADGILVGMREPALKKLGLDYDSLREINDKLIYCHVSGFPKDSEKKDAPGHDITYMAESGILSALFTDLTKVTTQPADMTGALYTVIAFVSSLAYRSIHNEGKFLEVNLYESPSILGLVNSYDKSLVRNLQGDWICYRVYEAADGQVALGALEEKFFDSFVKGLGHSEWQGQGMTYAESENGIFKELKSIFKSSSMDYWVDFGRSHDVPLEAVKQMPEKMEFKLPFRY